MLQTLFLIGCSRAAWLPGSWVDLTCMSGSVTLQHCRGALTAGAGVNTHLFRCCEAVYSVAVYSYSSAPHLAPSSDQHAAANITARVSTSSNQHQPAVTRTWYKPSNSLTCCYSAAFRHGNCFLTTGARVSIARWILNIYFILSLISTRNKYLSKH